MTINRGKFIVFEGPDGSGQTTQAELLKISLESRNREVIITKEPTKESEFSQKILDILNHKISATPCEFQELVSKDRGVHLQKTILPAINSGKIVVSDRYFFATLAYGQLDCPLDRLRAFNQDFPSPDITFILDVSPEICIARIERRGKPVQFFETKEKLEKVLANYRSLFSMIPNVYIVNGERSIEEIHGEILELVSKIL